MNKLITFPLLILMLIAGFCQVFNVGAIDLSHSSSLSVDSQGGTLAENESSTNVSTDSTNAIFNIDMVTGLIVLIIALVVVGVIAGIRVLGSGLSEKSVTLIYNSAVYYGLWGIFSVLAFEAFESITIMGLGLFLWLGLTLAYSLGFFETTWGSSGN